MLEKTPSAHVSLLTCTTDGCIGTMGRIDASDKRVVWLVSIGQQSSSHNNGGWRAGLRWLWQELLYSPLQEGGLLERRSVCSLIQRTSKASIFHWLMERPHCRTQLGANPGQQRLEPCPHPNQRKQNPRPPCNSPSYSAMVSPPYHLNWSQRSKDCSSWTWQSY